MRVPHGRDYHRVVKKYYPSVAQKQPRLVKTPPAGLSPPVEAHLRAWWWAARRAGNIGCGSLQANFDYIGGTKDWPELVHVGALAQAASRNFGRAISKGEMGAWMRVMGKSPIMRTVVALDHRGREKCRTSRTFYAIN